MQLPIPDRLPPTLVEAFDLALQSFPPVVFGIAHGAQACWSPRALPPVGIEYLGQMQDTCVVPRPAQPASEMHQTTE